MPILTVMNQKGGVGKTTSALNLAAALQERGRKVLMVDFDPQGSLTTCCGLADSNQLIDAATIADAVLTTVRAKSDRKVTLKDIIVTTPAGIDLAPASQDLATAEATLYTSYGREYALRDTLTQVSDLYDVILIDGVPTLGLLAVNGLAAADGLIIPVQAEYLAVYGLAQLLHNVEIVRERLNPRLKIWGIVLTMVDTRTKHSREVIATVRETFASQVPVFETHIPVDVKLKESAKAGMTVFAYDPAARATRAYRDLASEVEARFDEPLAPAVAGVDEQATLDASDVPANASADARSDAHVAAQVDASSDSAGRAASSTTLAKARSADGAQSVPVGDRGVSTPDAKPGYTSRSSNNGTRSMPQAPPEVDEHSNGAPQPHRRHSPAARHSNDILPPSLRRRVEVSQGTGSFPWLTDTPSPSSRDREADDPRKSRAQQAASASQSASWPERESEPVMEENDLDAQQVRDERDSIEHRSDESDWAEQREPDQASGSAEGQSWQVRSHRDADNASVNGSWAFSSRETAPPKTEDVRGRSEQELEDDADVDADDDAGESWSSPEDVADLRRRLDAFVPPTLKRATEKNWGSSTFPKTVSGHDGESDDASDEAPRSAQRSRLDARSAGEDVSERKRAFDSERDDGRDQPSRSTSWESIEMTSAFGNNGVADPEPERTPEASPPGTNGRSRPDIGMVDDVGPKSGGMLQSPGAGFGPESGLKSNGAARLTTPPQSVVVCPYLGLADNRNNHRSEPSAEHRCYAKSPPIEVNGWQQSTYCLGGRNGTCVHFLQARVQLPTDGNSSLFGKMRSAFKARGDGR